MVQSNYNTPVGNTPMSVRGVNFLHSQNIGLVNQNRELQSKCILQAKMIELMSEDDNDFITSEDFINYYQKEAQAELVKEQNLKAGGQKSGNCIVGIVVVAVIIGIIFNVSVCISAVAKHPQCMFSNDPILCASVLESRE